MPAKGRKRKAKADEPETAAAAANGSGDAAVADKKVKTDTAANGTAAPAAASAAGAADAKSDKNEKKAESPKEPEPKKLTEYNEVLCFGSGDMSQLGLGAGTLERKNPAPVKTLEGYNVISVKSGALHNAALLDNGQVWTWGCNDDAALGRDGDEWMPARVTGGGISHVFITQIACGDCHTIAIDDSGEVWSWGTYKDVKGVMGYNTKQEKQTVPAVVSGLLSNVQVVCIASSENNDIAIASNGDVFEWGDTRIGTRGSDRVKRTKLVPSRVLIHEQFDAKAPAAAADAKAGAAAATAKTKKPRKAASGKALKATGAWVCGMTTFVKTANDQVYVWGLNNYGQCGVGSRDNLTVPTRIPHLDGKGIQMIAGGEHHAMAIASDGTLYSWGRCHYGRLGHGNPTGPAGEDGKNKWCDADDRLVPTVVPALALGSAAVKADGHVVAIAAGESHSLAVTSGGAMYAWGFNELCQLGLGHDQEVNTPQRANGQQLTVVQRKVLGVSAGSQHSMLLARKVPGATAAAPAAPAAGAATAASAAAK